MILALALTVLSRSQTPNWIVKAEATGFTYVSTDAGEYGIDGVCTIQTNTVTCWRPDGTRDTALDAQADAMLLRSPGTDLQFVYRKRNLFLMVHEPESAVTSAVYYRGDAPPGRSSWLMQLINEPGGKGRRLMALMPVDAGLAATDIVAAIQVPLPSADVKFGRKTMTRFGPYTLEVGKPVHTPFGSVATYYGEWYIPYTVTPPPDWTQFTVKPVLLGRDSKPLRLKGPLPMLTIGGQPRFRSYEISQNGGPSGGQWVFTCDPKDIATIRLSPSYGRQVTFRNLQLVAKP